MEYFIEWARPNAVTRDFESSMQNFSEGVFFHLSVFLFKVVWKGRQLFWDKCIDGLPVKDEKTIKIFEGRKSK